MGGLTARGYPFPFPEEPADGAPQIEALARAIDGNVTALESSTNAALKAKYPMVVKTGPTISSPGMTTWTNMGCPTILKGSEDTSLITTTSQAVRVVKASIVRVECQVTFAFPGDSMRVRTSHILQANVNDYFQPAAWWGTGGPRIMVAVSRNGSVVSGSNETDFWAGSNPSVTSYIDPLIAVTVLEVL